MPRAAKRAHDIVVVRTRRGTVFAYVTKSHQTVRMHCKAFDFMESFNMAERRILQMFPKSVIEWDNVQVERGVAFGWLD